MDYIRDNFVSGSMPSVETDSGIELVDAVEFRYVISLHSWSLEAYDMNYSNFFV